MAAVKASTRDTDSDASGEAANYIYELRTWSCEWSQEVPALVMDHQPASVKYDDDWWQRLEKHGLVAGNMLSHNVEAARLYAAARGRRHSVYGIVYRILF